MMIEYTGQLIGGPDDGNFVSASTNVIPVTSIIEMWLDGDEKEAAVVTVKGVYIWDPKVKYFIWRLTSNDISTRKAEMAL